MSVNIRTYTEVPKNRKHILMVRIVLVVILILFVIWILRPFLVTKDNGKNKDTLDKIINLNQSNTRQSKSIFIIIITIILFALIGWLLPKFGINFFALLQKIIPLIASLRGILPF